MVKNSANVHIRFVHFIVYNFYLKKTLKEEETNKKYYGISIKKKKEKDRCNGKGSEVKAFKKHILITFQGLVWSLVDDFGFHWPDQAHRKTGFRKLNNWQVPLFFHLCIQSTPSSQL